MRKNNNIIEINGQRYDAKTGAVLSHADPSLAPAKQAPTATYHPQPASPHRPAATHTLMRQAVKKPGPSLKRQSKVQGHVDAPVKQPLGRLTIKRSAERLDAERLRHAKQIPKSRLISHFPAFTAGDVIKVHAAQQTTAAISRTSKPTKLKQPAAHAKRRPKTTAELLDQAVQQATSHLELPPKPVRRRSRIRRNAGLGAAALTVLVLGVIVTQNLSTVRSQIASAKAGLFDSQPSRQAAGPALGQFSHSGSTAAAQLRDNSGSH